MYENFKNLGYFLERTGVMDAERLALAGIDALPILALGTFVRPQLDEVLQVVRANPELHIVTAVEPGLYVNSFVPAGRLFYLADGDRNPRLIADRFDQFDAHYLDSLNSGSNKLRP